VVVPVAVEEFHVDFVDSDLLDGVGRAKTVLEHGAGAQVAQLGLDEGAQVARRTVLDAEHGMQIVVVLDDHAGTELGGRNRHAADCLLERLRSMGPATVGSSLGYAGHGDQTPYFTRS